MLAKGNNVTSMASLKLCVFFATLDCLFSRLSLLRDAHDHVFSYHFSMCFTQHL